MFLAVLPQIECSTCVRRIHLEQHRYTYLQVFGPFLQHLLLDRALVHRAASISVLYLSTSDFGILRGVNVDARRRIKNSMMLWTYCRWLTVSVRLVMLSAGAGLNTQCST